jgi:endonuclease/exonuclease/phosphatase family metal-dependent hydrolase
VLIKFPALATVAVLAAACAPTVNLLNPTSPKFEGSYAGSIAATVGTGSRILVVSFNIKLADRIGPAIEVLRSDRLRDADIISLQEMDETGVDRIARALGLNYVYYPGSIHPVRHRYFGTAILTRWPVAETRKVILPHEGWGRRQRRNATAATIEVRGSCVRVYAVHLETQHRASQYEREDQVDAILADASTLSCPVVVAGDFNSKGIGKYFEQKGYAWPTKNVGKTISFFSWDHIFARGLGVPDSAAAGKVLDVQGASDHRPVWASLILTDEAGRRGRPSSMFWPEGRLFPALLLLAGPGPGEGHGAGTARVERSRRARHIPQNIAGLLRSDHGATLSATAHEIDSRRAGSDVARGCYSRCADGGGVSVGCGSIGGYMAAGLGRILGRPHSRGLMLGELVSFARHRVFMDPLDRPVGGRVVSYGRGIGLNTHRHLARGINLRPDRSIALRQRHAGVARHRSIIGVGGVRPNLVGDGRVGHGVLRGHRVAH